MLWIFITRRHHITNAAVLWVWPSWIWQLLKIKVSYNEVRYNQYIQYISNPWHCYHCALVPSELDFKGCSQMMLTAPPPGLQKHDVIKLLQSVLFANRLQGWAEFRIQYFYFMNWTLLKVSKQISPTQVLQLNQIFFAYLFSCVPVLTAVCCLHYIVSDLSRCDCCWQWATGHLVHSPVSQTHYALCRIFQGGK